MLQSTERLLYRERKDANKRYRNQGGGMLTLLTGMSFAQEGEGNTRNLAALPVGVFVTDKYGKTDLSQKVCDQMIEAFDAGIPRNGVFIDVDHDFGKARGWVKSLGYGVYLDDKGKEKPAVVAEIGYTAEGEQMLADGEYRGTSCAFGPHTDPETGTEWPVVLRAISLTNLPVLTMLPEPLNESVRMLSGEFAHLVVLGEETRMGMRDRIGKMFSGLLKLGEVADKADEDRDQWPEGELEVAGYAVWDATSAFEKLVREAINGGLTGDALMSRFEELSADLPLAIVESIQAAVAKARENRAKGAEPAQPAEPVDPTEGVALSDDDPLNPDSAAGGEEMDEDTKLAIARAEAAEAELATLKAAQADANIDATLDKLSERGMDEASRKAIKDVLTSTGMVTLSEGHEVSRDEALLLALAEVKWVPVTKELSALEGPQDDGVDPAVVKAREEVRTQLGTTPSE